MRTELSPLEVGRWHRGAVLLIACALLTSCKSRKEKAPVLDVPAPELAVPSKEISRPVVTAPPSATSALTLGIEGRGPASPHEFVLCSADNGDPDAALALASEHYQEGKFLEANACAQLATDLVPQAVEAQHLRAASLIGLARYEEAQVAFAMALVLDPDDPETLADVADFFINILPPKRRETVEVGLQYARRGVQRATARRRSDQKLQGRLLLLEGEALNDLGDPEAALVRVEEALALVPDLARAEHELAVSFFHLLRFEESEDVFLKLLSKTPDDAYAHHHLGLIYEHQGRTDDAEAHFSRAMELAPDEFRTPVILSREDFAKEVASAIAELPEELADLVRGVELELADVPLLVDLQASNPPFAPTILGLYRGLPAGVKASPGAAGEPPQDLSRTLILYRKNLGRTAASRSELNRQIRRTLRHEVGHLQGYNEDQLRRLGLE